MLLASKHSAGQRLEMTTERLGLTEERSGSAVRESKERKSQEAARGRLTKCERLKKKERSEWKVVGQTV